MNLSKARLLRWAMWSSVVLAVLFQIAFLVELHSALSSDAVLWTLSVISAGCLLAGVLARHALIHIARINYRANSEPDADMNEAPLAPAALDRRKEGEVKTSRRSA